MSDTTALGAAILYALALFGVAALAQRSRGRPQRWRPPAYALALAVYCTSWTFYGAVGSAAVEGWTYLPIYVGPILVYLVGAGFVRRLIGAAQREGATSIADFIGSRFGKSRPVATLVTLLALFGTVPYLALQLRSVGSSYAALTGGGAVPAMVGTAIFLALFAALFGTRRYDAAARNPGLVAAIAVESLVKLLALVAVAVFAVVLLGDLPEPTRSAGVARLAAGFDPADLGLDVLVITVLSAAAVLCLPRQFHIGVIEAAAPGDGPRARWSFAAYLLAMALVVPPIAAAGLATLPGGVPPDLYVLDLPLAAGANALALLVFLGGFSAATGMVVVETIALSTMISNDLVAPALLRARLGSDLGRALLWVRRAAIVAVMAAALAYALTSPMGGRLAALGLVAFAAMAQFAPALVLAVHGGDRDPRGVSAGLATGLATWLWTLFLPTVLPARWLAPFAGTLVDPVALGSMEGLTPLTHGVLWSVGLNLLVHGLVAARPVRAPTLRVAWGRRAGIGEVRDVGGLVGVVRRFAEPYAVAAVFGPSSDLRAPVTARDARAAERLIAGAVGAPSARAIMAAALAGEALRLTDVARMLDASGQSLRFSKGLLAATLEHIEPAVSVVDRELDLVAWNSRYLELFDYPPGMVRVGAPVADLIRWNFERGECGPGEIDRAVARRLTHMRRGAPHSFERRRPDGRVIKTVGGPMPGGGYVMCFTDITAEARARDELVAARAGLEARVAERTRDLVAANAALASATREKTRFLAAASHDLLQPLHAARLFAAALARDATPATRPLVGNLTRSIAAADELLRALLDISKLDAGGIVPRPSRFAARALLEELAGTFAPMAAERRLRLRVGNGDALVDTDRTLLRSIVQNLVANAIRYTADGGVLIGVRRRDGRVAIEVWDTGPGIGPADQRRIWAEFERGAAGGDGGAGLGLAIVERTAALLGAEVSLRSAPGRGSRFTVVLDGALDARAPTSLAPSSSPAVRAGIRALVVEDDPAVRDATAALMRAWGYDVAVAADPAAARAAGAVDIVLVDLELGAVEDGLTLITRMRARRPGLRAALVTGDRAPATAARASRGGVPLFLKPLDPDDLARWLAGAARDAAE